MGLALDHTLHTCSAGAVAHGGTHCQITVANAIACPAIGERTRPLARVTRVAGVTRALAAAGLTIAHTAIPNPTFKYTRIQYTQCTDRCVLRA